MEELISEARRCNESLAEDVLRSSLQTAVRFAERGDEHAPFKGLLFIVGDPSRIKERGECTMRTLQDLEGTIQDVCNDTGNVPGGLKLACSTDGAVVIHASTGKLVCGSFSVDELSGAARGLRGQRGRAASSIAQLTQSFAIKVSQDCCGSTNAPPKDGILEVFAGSNERKTLKFEDVHSPSFSEHEPQRGTTQRVSAEGQYICVSNTAPHGIAIGNMSAPLANAAGGGGANFAAVNMTINNSSASVNRSTKEAAAAPHVAHQREPQVAGLYQLWPDKPYTFRIEQYGTRLFGTLKYEGRAYEGHGRIDHHWIEWTWPQHAPFGGTQRDTVERMFTWVRLAD